MLAPGRAACAVLLAWVSVLAPTLAFAGIGLLTNRSRVAPGQACLLVDG
jgi:hypothetical protein